MMTFDEAMREAALKAEAATNRAMAGYAEGLVTDEDDLTGRLLGNLEAGFDGQIGGLTWKASTLRHRAGVASEEAKVGADFLIHVSVKTPAQSYSKGVLVQAKRVEPFDRMSKRDHDELKAQCKKMSAYSAASFVFDYAKGSMRCGSASKIGGSTDRELYKACTWRSYRFYLELFRCPIGDVNITSALYKDLQVPVALVLKGVGDITVDDPD